MIKIDKGQVEIVGSEPVVRAEFCVLCRNLAGILGKRYGKEEGVKKIRGDLEDALISEEELKKKADECLKEIFGENPNKLMELLKEAMANG